MFLLDKVNDLKHEKYFYMLKGLMIMNVFLSWIIHCRNNNLIVNFNQLNNVSSSDSNAVLSSNNRCRGN